MSIKINSNSRQYGIFTENGSGFNFPIPEGFDAELFEVKSRYPETGLPSAGTPNIIKIEGSMVHIHGDRMWVHGNLKHICKVHKTLTSLI